MGILKTPSRGNLKTLLKIKNCFFCFYLLFTSACSSLGNRSSTMSADLYYVKKYSLEDKSGRFIMEREVGLSKTKKVFTKYQVTGEENGSKALERSIVISSVGIFNNKYRLLRPYAHQYDVWFEKKKYSSKGNIDLKTKSMKLSLESPEEQWNKPETHRFPKSESGAFCYFSQIMECAIVSGFVYKALKNNGGSMYLTLIWEGYPYIQEQYLNIPQGFFTSAALEFDGENKNGEKRFTLKFGENALFYFLDEKMQLSKIFWPSQGLSIVELGRK